MKLPPVLIAHGEKIVLGLVLAGCAWMVASTVLDSSTKPAISEGAIKTDSETIRQAKQTTATPGLKPLVRYGDRIRTRLATQNDVVRVPRYLAAHPSVSTTVNDTPIFPYVYALGAPEVALGDALDAITVRVELPPLSGLPNDVRLSGDPQKAWTRRINMGGNELEVGNRAQVVGIEVQVRNAGSDDDAWRPLETTDAPAGQLLLGKGKMDTVLKPVEEWRTYEVRARVLATATAFEDSLSNEVLVVDAGAFVEGLAGKSINWDFMLVQARSEDRKLRGQLFPVRDPGGPVARELGQRERLFRGSWSPVVRRQAASSVRMVLDGVSSGLGTDGPRATLLLSRRYPEGWVAPVKFQIGVGGAVGDPRHVGIKPWEKVRSTIDLGTPYTVKEIKTGLERVLHYEVKAVSDGQGGRALEQMAYKREWTAVVLTNTVTKEDLTLYALGSIAARAAESANLKIFPRLPGRDKPIVEEALFAKDPGAFVQPVLAPPTPILHQPGTGPLVGHPKVVNQPSAPYVELPDGRLIYIDPLNSRLGLQEVLRPGAKPLEPLPGSEPAATAAATRTPGV
jgi:hypothetical protein